MIKNSNSIILIKNQSRTNYDVERKTNIKISSIKTNAKIAINQIAILTTIAKTRNRKYIQKNSFRSTDKKLDDLIIFKQIDIMKNSLTNNNNSDEFSSTNFNKTFVKRRRKKFRTTKCDKIKIKINDNEIFAIMNSKAKINLINNVLVKKFKLILFDVSFCEIMILNNNQLKIYDVYFVRLEVSNENDVNRFFNENFLEVDLF